MGQRRAKGKGSNKELKNKTSVGTPAEEALPESEELYKHLADALPEPVVILQDDRYQYVNPAFTSVFGYTRQDLERGLSFLETIQEKDKKAARQTYKNRLAGKQAQKNFSIDLIAKNGTLVPCETSATMIQYQGRPADLVVIHDITERRRAEENLTSIKWMLSKGAERIPSDSDTATQYCQSYGDLTELNTSGVILKSVGKGLLAEIAGDYLRLLDSSGAIYETNGDYAQGIFSSGWCRLLDDASRKLCDTHDNKMALDCGKWRCHESCWNDASKVSIQKGEPVDIECAGGISLYAVPIRVGNEIVGSVNFGYGDPPRDAQELRRISEEYGINQDTLIEMAKSYASRPAFIVETAKARLLTSAKLIGEIVDHRQTEQALRESEQRFRTSVENMLDCFGIYSAIRDEKGRIVDFRIEYVNEAACTSNRIAREDQIGKRLLELMPAHRESGLFDEYCRVVEEGKPIVKESLVYEDDYKKEHLVRAFDIRVSKLGDGFTAAWRDITERKRSEEKTRQMKETYDRITDNADEVIFRVNAEGGQVTYANPAAERLFGYSLAELLADKTLAFKMIHPDFADEQKRIIEEINTSKKTVKNAVLGWIAKDGREIIVEYTIIPVTDKEGKLVYFESIGRDITERKRAEETLRVRSHDLGERVKELNCLYGFSQLTVDPNRSINDVLSELVELIPPSWQYPDITCARIVFEDQEFHTRNYRETPWRQSANIMVSGRHMGTLEVCYLEDKSEIDEGPFLKEERDLIEELAREAGKYTERKRAEEEIRKLNRELEKRVRRRTRELEAVNSELESFVYSVSHDLRAPLRAMDGFSEALAEEYAEKLDEKAITYIIRVQRASHKMGQLIDDLLSLSHVSRGELSLQKFDISAVAESVMSDLRQAQPERQVQVSIEPNLVDKGDLRLLRVVLYNLLDNAWKFTGKVDEAKIEFGRTETDKGPTFFVRDNGVGFDMRYVHKLFGAFQRLHRESEFEGTGIGLATVARIIGRHGGQAWGEGKVGRGATFYFTLPATTEDNNGHKSHLVGGRQPGRR